MDRERKLCWGLLRCSRGALGRACCQVRRRIDNNDGARCGRGLAPGIRGDVIDGVGRCGRGVEDDVGGKQAIQEGLDPDVVPGAVYGGRAEVFVAVCYVSSGMENQPVFHIVTGPLKQQLRCHSPDLFNVVAAKRR